MGSAIQHHWKQEQAQPPERELREMTAERVPEQTKNPGAGEHRDHPVRPGHLPTHLRCANELSQDQRIRSVSPGRLDLRKRIADFGAKQKIGTLRQLVAKERVNKVYRSSQAAPTNGH